MSQQDTAGASNEDVSEVEVIRQEIARTQDDMGGTLEAIQEKLSPGALLAEAQGPVEETTDHIVAEVQRAVRESMDHLLSQAREPVEEVTDHLIARATGAVEEVTSRLVVEATDAIEEATDHILERARVTATETASSIVEQTGHAVREATIGKVEKMASKIGESTRDMADTANETTRGLGSTVMQTIERNPLPAALAAVGLGWLYLKRPKGASGYSSSNVNGNGRTMNASTNGASDAVGQVGDVVKGTASTVADTVTGTANAVGDAAGSLGETVGGTTSAVGDAVSGAATMVGGTVGQVADGTQDAARNLFTELQFQALRIEEGFKTLAEQNPLALGAAGIALGSVIGLAIPETQVEHKFMGKARDAVLDQVGETAQDGLNKVGHVAAEVGKTAKQEAVAGGLVS